MVKIRHRIKPAGVEARYLPGRMADILGSNDVGRAEDFHSRELQERLLVFVLERLVDPVVMRIAVDANDWFVKR